MTRKNTSPLEGEIQEALFRWAALAGGRFPALRFMHHIPNGGSRNKIEAAKLKRHGVKAGVPDIFLPAAHGGYHGLYIEMKRGGEMPRSSQREFIEYLRGAGYCVCVCHDWDTARKIIEEYLGKDRTKT